MAAGKSSVGRALARLLAAPFLDLDREIERRAGKTVRAIFQTRGEPAFRRLESAEVARAARGKGRVVALGGGAVLNPKNAALLRRTGRVVYLRAGEAALLARGARGKSRRPLWSGPGDMRRLLARRRPAYRRAAHLAVRSDVGTPERVARRIADKLGLI